MKRTLVKVSTEVYIEHSWDTCSIAVVDFLKNKHVHKMFITVEIEVSHSDRQCEFFVLRADIVKAICSLYPDIDLVNIHKIGSRSMEMVAQELFDYLEQFGYPTVSAVECSEDGFFSGKIERKEGS